MKFKVGDKVLFVPTEFEHIEKKGVVVFVEKPSYRGTLVNSVWLEEDETHTWAEDSDLRLLEKTLLEIGYE